MGLISWRLPWGSWPRSATHLLIPVAFALIGTGIFFSGEYDYVFGIFFCAVFIVAGVAHKPGIGLKLLPLLAIANVLPLAIKTTDLSLAASFAVATGLICVAIAETLAWVTARLQRSQAELWRIYTAMDEISADLTSLDPKDLARNAAVKLSELLLIPDVVVYSLSENGTLQCLAGVEEGRPNDNLCSKRTDIAGWSAGSEAVRTQAPVLGLPPDDDTSRLSNARETRKQARRPSMTIPLVARGRVIGLVELNNSRRIRPFSLEEERTAGSICRLIAPSIENAQTLGEKQAHTNWLASMLELNKAVADTDTLDEALAVVTHRATRALRVSSCVVYEYMPEADAVVARAMWEETPTGWNRLGEALPLCNYPAEERILSLGIPLLEKISDPDLDPVSREHMTAWGEKTCLTVPMYSADKPMGLLVLWDSERERCFSADEMQLVAGLANLAGDAIRHAKLTRSLQHLSTTDSLTGLANHRQIHEALVREEARSARSLSMFSLVMLDIDGFKLLNDTYGHPNGDAVLKHVAALLRENTRTTDVAGRFGGDEFILILPETDPTEAEVVVAKLHDALTNTPFHTPTGTVIPIHASFGISTFPVDGLGANELMVAADARLYASKRRGGNKVTGASHMKRNKSDVGALGFLNSMVTAVDNRDGYTRRHSDQVTELAMRLAKALGLSESSLRVVRVAGLLHDVGKIGIPERILRKPGPLTEAECAIVRGHPSLAGTLLRAAPDLAEIQAAVVSHHERFDGTGYPDGLADIEIPLLARILAITDAYAAMTTNRPYREALTPQEAIAELRANAGTHFDPDLVATFVRCLEGSEADGWSDRLEPASTSVQPTR